MFDHTTTRALILSDYIVARFVAVRRFSPRVRGRVQPCGTWQVIVDSEVIACGTESHPTHAARECNQRGRQIRDTYLNRS